MQAPLVANNARLAREIRSDVWRIADTVFPAGSLLLDAGCGTGEEAVHFARNGCDVTAIDISPAMISKLKAKAGESGVGARIDFRVADIRQFVPDPPTYDGIFSNFGALNRVARLSQRKASGPLSEPGWDVFSGVFGVATAPTDPVNLANSNPVPPCRHGSYIIYLR